MNQLYFGDNLLVLRESIKDESIDLVYLDPPFNSKANYNVLFKSPRGQQSPAQITAFEDSWHWGEQAEGEFNELLHGPNTDTAEMVAALRKFLGENDMMAYLTMMASRLIEMHRALKLTGSLYLHCDPTASHYLKIVLDGIFGPAQFRNEIVWRRANAHNDPKRYGRITDSIFYYSKGDNPKWNPQFTPYREQYYESHFKRDSSGRYFRTVPLDAPRHGDGSPGLLYEWRGKRPASTRTWAIRMETMKQYEQDKKIVYTRTGTPTLLQYADEMPGVPLQNIWTDIPPVNPQANERLGYPTQKPIALLERIVNSSSSEGDVVLDPFCGCGTAIHAAQKLRRQWIGIDVTNLAIAIVEKRLRDAFPGIKFDVLGTPKDLDGAIDLANRDKYEFQYWACSLVDAQPYRQKKKGADGGIDGLIYFQDDKGSAKTIVVSVKGGQNVSVQMIRDLRGVVEREKSAVGIFVTLANPTGPMRAEAIKAGYYTSPHGKKFPKLQVLTIEGLLKGAEAPKYPDLSVGQQTFKRARREDGVHDQAELFSSETLEQGGKGNISILKRRPPIRVGKSGAQQSSNRIAAAATRRPTIKRQ